MKAIKFLILSAIAISLYSCDKKVENLLDIKFDIPSQSFNATIDTTSIYGEDSLSPITINIDNLDSLAKKNGTSISKLKSVKAKTITIDIVSPDTATFNIVDNGSIILSNPGKDNKTKIASFSNIPKGSKSLNVAPDDVNLLDFVKEKQLTLLAKLKTNKGVKEKIQLKITIKGEAIANPTN